jgi:hypothetical protein
MVMYLYVGSVRYVISILFASICYILITRLVFCNIIFVFVFYFVFLFSILKATLEYFGVLTMLKKLQNSLAYFFTLKATSE